MSTIVLTDIAFEPNTEGLVEQLRVRAAADRAELTRLVGQAAEVAQPKAAYRAAYLGVREDSAVIIDDVRLTSRVLSVNLRDAHRVFLYMATCGAELDAWAHAQDDMLHQFWAEEIKVQALRAATRALNARIDADYRPGKTTTMNPGSLADWPLSQQKPFFTLMADAAERIGVTLSDSCLMTPNKSVTGIRYATESGFESCQLCPMPDCPGRRAPHDPDLFARTYGPDSGS